MVVKINKSATRPEMPEAIIGNSRMLASLKRNGEIFRLFWPRIDYGQHLGRFWTGIRAGKSSTKWFHLNEWASSQRYLGGTNILETTLTGLSSRLRVTQRDFVLPLQDLLTRHYQIENTGSESKKITFYLYCSFEIEESVLYDGVFLDFTSHSLVFFRRDVYFAVAGCGYPLAGYQCGRRETSTDPYCEATEGALWETGTPSAGAPGAWPGTWVKSGRANQKPLPFTWLPGTGWKRSGPFWPAQSPVGEVNGWKKPGSTGWNGSSQAPGPWMGVRFTRLITGPSWP